MSLDVDNYLHQVSTCKYLPPSVKSMCRISALSTNSTSVGRLVFHKHETNDHLRFLSSGAFRGKMRPRAGLFRIFCSIFCSVLSSFVTCKINFHSNEQFDAWFSMSWIIFSCGNLWGSPGRVCGRKAAKCFEPEVKNPPHQKRTTLHHNIICRMTLSV